MTKTQVELPPKRPLKWASDYPASRTFDEFYHAIRGAGADAWDNLDVEQELAAMRGQPQGIEALVCDDITERQALGIQKYGKTVAENPLCLLEWLEHAYQECLDQAIYLRRSMAEIDKIMAKKASATSSESKLPDEAKQEMVSRAKAIVKREKETT